MAKNYTSSVAKKCVLYFTIHRGSIFIDETDYYQDARILYYIEDAVQDGVILKSGNRRIILKHIHFVECKEDGTAVSGGYVPYLDYRAASSEEQAAIRGWMQGQQWLCSGIEDRAKGYAIQHLIPEHFVQVKTRKEAILNKTAKAVKDRMTAEVQYWDYRAGELAQKEAAGKANAKLNSKLAARRAEELEARMQARLGEIEKELGYQPRDVSTEKRGYIISV